MLICRRLCLSFTIPFRLEIHIYHFAVLVNCSPDVTLLAIYSHEDFIDEQGLTTTSIFSFEPCGVDSCTDLAPLANRLIGPIIMDNQDLKELTPKGRF